MKQEYEVIHDEWAESSVPVCAQNFVSPVVDQACFIEKVHYKIGEKIYIEQAPHF